MVSAMLSAQSSSSSCGIFGAITSAFMPQSVAAAQPVDAEQLQRSSTSGGRPHLRRFDTLHATVLASVSDPAALYAKNLKAIKGELAHDEALPGESVPQMMAFDA